MVVMVLLRCVTKLVILLLQINCQSSTYLMTIFVVCMFTVDDGVINPVNLPGSVSTTMVPPFLVPPWLKNISKYSRLKVEVDMTVCQLSSL
jgi:hypothetical protein